jgi:anti-anti-sigma factor
MELRIEQTGETRVIVLTGRLDGTTSQTVETAILELVGAGAVRIVFDFNALEYISSAGLRVMLLAAKKMRAAAGKVALFGLNANVREVFEMSGFHTIFTLLDSREAALEFVAG